MKGISGLVAVLAIALCLSACIAAPPKRLDWRTNASPTSAPAVLLCWPSLQILSIDGDKKGLAVGDGLWFQNCEIQIDPGAHSLVVRHYSRGGGRIAITSSTGEIPIQFVADPGGRYQLVGKKVKVNGAWVPNAYEVHVRPESK